MKELQLSQGKVAIVDEEDYERASQFKWCASQTRPGCFYAVRSENRKTVYLHAFIMGRKWIDHKDGDGLNCVRANMRPATRQQNQVNRPTRSKSGFRGVYASGKKWAADIVVDRKTRHIGRFACIGQAARAYDAAAKSAFGEFARTNFL
jgi:hypothetical protein